VKTKRLKNKKSGGKNMRKILSILLIAVMLITAVACAPAAPAATEPAADTTTTEAAPATEATTTDTGIKDIAGMTVAFIPKLTGNSFFEAANAGAQKYVEQWASP